MQDKVTASQEAGEEESSSLSEMQEGLKKSSAALEAAQAQVAAGQEEVQELTQRLTAAQADIASLQVCAYMLHKMHHCYQRRHSQSEHTADAC